MVNGNMDDKVWERTCEHHWDEPDTKSTYCVTCGIPYWAYEWIKQLKDQLEQQAKDAELGRTLKPFRIAEVIARNLTAWDTSKDKSQGLLPEVYLTNQAVYRALTGEEYNFYKACKKFNIE